MASNFKLRASILNGLSILVAVLFIAIVVLLSRYNSLLSVGNQPSFSFNCISRPIIDIFIAPIFFITECLLNKFFICFRYRTNVANFDIDWKFPSHSLGIKAWRAHIKSSQSVLIPKTVKMFKLFVVLALFAAASAQINWRAGVQDGRCPQRSYEIDEIPVFFSGAGCNDFRVCNDGWSCKYKSFSWNSVSALSIFSVPFTCPNALNWDQGRLTCNWAEEAPCNGRRWFTADEIPTA